MGKLTLMLAKFLFSASDEPRKKFNSATKTTIFTFQSPKRAFSSSDDYKALLRSEIQGH